MEGMTIFIVYNEKQNVELSIESIRLFRDVENVNVIVVDNHSHEKPADWLINQQEIAYVYSDEGKMPYGKMFNEIINEFKIEGHILLLYAGCLIVPGTLSRMLQVAESGNVGAVGPVSNAFVHYQRERGFPDFKNALEASSMLSELKTKECLGLDPRAVLINAHALKSIGFFDEQLEAVEYVVRDICLRLIMEDWSIMVCESAIVWRDEKKRDMQYNNYTDEVVLEKKWGMRYFNTMYNENLISLINEKHNACFKVLEVGCDCGATLLEIKNCFPNALVFGTELNESAATVAKHFADVSINNIEEQNLDFSEGMFDYIIFGDVLEHLRDPLRAIEYCKDLLRDGGYIVASIPNLMHISVIEGLLQGDFTYTETGLLDKTHIHFFTFNEIVRLFRGAGYKLAQVSSVETRINERQNVLLDNLLVLGEADRFMYETFQYVVKAEK